MNTRGMSNCDVNLSTSWILAGALFAAGCGGANPPPKSPEPDPATLLAEEEEPAGAAAPASSGEVKQGMDAIAAGDLEKAKELLSSAAASSPEDPQAVFYLGVAQSGLGEAEEAVTSFEKALSLQPKFPEASLNLSALLLDLGKGAEALAVVEEGLKNAPGDAALTQNKAMALLLSGDAAGASDAFKVAVGTAPEDEELRFLYAQSLLQAGKDAEAQVELKKLASSGKVEVLASVADLFGRLKQWDDCLSALDKAVGLRDAAELHVKRGLCLHGKSDEGAAKEAFLKAISQDDSFSKAHFYLGHNYKASGDKKAAVAAFERVVELEKDSRLGQLAKSALSKL